MSSTDWMADAACREADPELFFTDVQGPAAQLAAEEAIAICNTCPVTDECESYRVEVGALWGVWAGVKLPRPRHITATWMPAQHGTDAGYTAHRRAGTEPCQRCRDAHNRMRLERKTRQRRGVA